MTRNNELNKPRIEIDVFSNRISARLTQVQIIILKEKIFLTNLTGQLGQTGEEEDELRNDEDVRVIKPAKQSNKHL